MKLDAIDYKILAILQKDATTSSAQMASLIGVSQTPTWRRMTQLDAAGIVKERVAIIDRHAVALNFMAYVFVRLKDQQQSTVNGFRDAVIDIPEIVQCHVLLGDIDFMLQVVTQDLETYHKFLRGKLSTIPGVVGIDTRPVVEETKNTARIPLHITDPGDMA